MTGQIFGVPWRIRLDKYIDAGRTILDWKTCANIQELKWNEALHEKATFIDNYGYMMRAAVYSEIEKQNANSKDDPLFIIVAISKEEPPDKEALLLNHRQRYDYELEQIKEKLPYFYAIKTGSMKPRRCGHCDYCRSTKQLSEIKPYYALLPQFRPHKEEEYDDITNPPLADSQTPGSVGDMPPVQCTDSVGSSVGLEVDAL